METILSFFVVVCVLSLIDALIRVVVYAIRESDFGYAGLNLFFLVAIVWAVIVGFKG